ncbi:MAG: hypothetical protein OEZ39_20320 [Gammaproteobacteria bacterium]|nr:hypothetical protein [Gammaproteobacteria bacterium]
MAETATPFIHVLDTVGDGSGIHAIDGDYSAVAQSFSFRPTANIYTIAIVTIHLGYSGTLVHNRYADLATALTNGLKIRSVDSGDNVLVDLMGGLPIKENHHFAHFVTEKIVTGFAASQWDTAFIMRLYTDFTKGIQIDGTAGEYFELYANDNFTGVADHHCIIKGAYHS